MLKVLAVCGVVGIIALVLDIDTKEHIHTGADAVKSGADMMKTGVDKTEDVLTGKAVK